MNKSLASLFVSALATFVWALPTAYSAAPIAEESSGKTVALQIDVTSLPEEEQGVAPVVLKELRSLLEQAGHRVTNEPDADTVVLRTRLRRMEAGNRNYGIHFEFVDGDRATPAIEWFECIFCTEARVLERLRESGPDLLAAIDRQQASVEADTGEDTADDGSESGDEPPIAEPVKPIGPLGYAGIGVTVLGLGATIGGAVEISRGRVYDPATDRYQLTGTDHRPVGYALLGVGAAATVAGVIMLGADVGKRAKQRKQAPRQALIIPSITPSSAGIGVVGRF